MIASGAQRNGRTNRSQAIIESDATKSAAPTRGDDVAGREGGGEHRRDHHHVRRHRDAAARRARRRRTIAARIRRPSGPTTATTTTTAIAECERRRAVRPEADEVPDVRDEERREPGNEEVLRQHQQHVADEREHQRGDEPGAPASARRPRDRAGPRPRSARPALPACRRTRRTRSRACGASGRPRSSSRPRTRRRTRTQPPSPRSWRQPFALPGAVPDRAGTARDRAGDRGDPASTRARRPRRRNRPRTAAAAGSILAYRASTSATRANELGATRRHALCGDAARADAMPARPALPVARRLVVRSTRRTGPDDAHLPFLLPPVEHERGARIGRELSALRALEVGEEHEPPFVEAAQQHRARRHRAVGRGGRERHRVRLAHAGRGGLVVPAPELRDRDRGRRNRDRGVGDRGQGHRARPACQTRHRCQNGAWLFTTSLSPAATSRRPTASTPRPWASSWYGSKPSPTPKHGWARHLFYDTGNGEMLAIWDLHDDEPPRLRPRDLDRPRPAELREPHRLRLAVRRARRQARPVARARLRRRAHRSRLVHVDLRRTTPAGSMVEFCATTRAFTADDRREAQELLAAAEPPLNKIEPPIEFFEARSRNNATVS